MNDPAMPAPPSRSPADLLATPEIARVLAGILRKAGIPAQDLSDAVGDVQLRVLRSLRNRPVMLWPGDLEEWKRLSIRAARSHLIDQWRRAKRRKELGDQGLVAENPDEAQAPGRRPSERDPIDQKRALALLDEFLDGRADVDDKILEGLLDDKDQAEIAKELGLSHQQVRDRVRSMRAAFRVKAGAALGGILTVVLVLFLGGPHEPRYYARAPEQVLADAPPEEVAADLRDQARPMCQSRQWDRCMQLIDDAAVLDPQGDRAPEIQAARDAYQQLLDDQQSSRMAKPGDHPPRPRPAPGAPPAPSAPRR
jgi:DNA-directed RNA polymerase specialized sigma24 family protein